jgi:hypothetical protein
MRDNRETLRLEKTVASVTVSADATLLPAVANFSDRRKHESRWNRPATFC